MARVVGIFLSVAGMAQAQGPAASGSASAYPTQFEVASVRMLEKPAGDGLTNISKPGELLFTAHNVSLLFLVEMAFGVSRNEIQGPSWMDSTVYDVSARPDAEKGPTYEQLKPMLQQLLAQRFHLQAHTGLKEMKGYSLVVARGGSKLAPSEGGVRGEAYIKPSELGGSGISAKGLASLLSQRLRQPVRDDTGIVGKFDVRLHFAPPNADVGQSTLPSIFTAVQEQLGLKLEPAKVTVQIVVVDHVERVPTEN